MRTDQVGTRRVRALRVLVAILVTLTPGAGSLADEVVGSDESAAEIAVRAATSAGDLAASARSLESSLRSAAPAAKSGGVLSTDEYNALVEAGMKQQLAGLADELDQISAALASGENPDGLKVLLESVNRRAAALSLLGAGPARVPIPQELQAAFLALRSDLKILSGSRAAVSAPVPDSEPEVP